jgi:hypothetical protein
MKKMLMICAAVIAMTTTAHADDLAQKIIKQSQVKNYNLCIDMLAVDFIHLQGGGVSPGYLEQWRKRNEKDCEAYLPKD